MKNISFEWDEKKNKINIKKHNVSFDEAKSVFYDENSLLINDPDHSFDEDRFVLVGLSYKLRVLIVCHCYRENDKIIRIISSRKATKKEIKFYFEGI